MKYLIGALVLLNVLDAVLTRHIIEIGAGRESNPFLLGIVGEPIFFVVKVVGVLLCAFILWDMSRHHPRLARISTTCFVAIYSGIVLWNFSLLA